MFILKVVQLLVCTFDFTTVILFTNLSDILTEAASTKLSHFNHWTARAQTRQTNERIVVYGS